MIPRQPITPAQLRYLQIQWSRLAADGDPRALERPGNCLVAPHREGRLAWATAHLGREIKSFSDISKSEAGYLLDILAGKRPKLCLRLDRAFRDAKIADPNAWYDGIMRWESGRRKASQFWWRFHGREHLADLNRHHVYLLIQILTTRAKPAPSGEKQQESPCAPSA